MRDDPPDDATLVRRMRAGEDAAFREFLERYERLIYAVPRRMGLSADDAADVFQDVTIAFLKGLPRLREPRTIPRWLTQTAFRIARDRRARSRREVRPEDEAFWARQPDDAPGAAEILAAFEARTAVQAALQGMGARCRDLLELLFLTTPTPGYRDIASRLGVPIGSLGPTRQRCLDRLLEILAAAGIRKRSPLTLSSGARPPGVSKGRTR